MYEYDLIFINVVTDYKLDNTVTVRLKVLLKLGSN